MQSSRSVPITPSDNGISVNIFNITSLTSGCYGKEALNILKYFNIDPSDFYPTSFVRDPNKTTEYGNVSQTFKLFIPFSNCSSGKYVFINDVIKKGSYDTEDDCTD